MLEKPKNKPKRKRNANMGRVIMLFIAIDCIVAIVVVAILFATGTIAI